MDAVDYLVYADEVPFARISIEFVDRLPNHTASYARRLQAGRIVQDMTSFERPSPIKPTVSMSVLDQLDIRVGTIVEVAELPKSDKLVRLIVDFGDHRRQILAGMKQERPNPKEIEGKQALFVVNLEHRKIMGEMSEGMLFDIGYADGVTPALAMPERPVPNGVRAG